MVSTVIYCYYYFYYYTRSVIVLCFQRVAVITERDVLALSKSPFVVQLFYSLQSKHCIFLVSRLAHTHTPV